MKKIRFFKALFVAAALALMIPGCSDVNSDEGTNIPQTQGNKVALKISASEGYRTALPTVDLTSYTYELTADEVTENTAANNPATLIPTGTSYADLTKANSVYVEADKTYLFALKATNGSSDDILSGTLTKAISASDSTLSFQLFAIDSTSDKGSVSIEVTYADGYGVASVVPTLHNMDGTSLATDYPLTYTAGDTAGTGTITGSVPVGASYVNLVLKDESSTEIGSLPQEAVYAVKGLTSSGTVNVQVKKYKATVNVLSGGTVLTEAKTVTLKMLDPNKNDGSELEVTKTLTQTSGTNEYIGYVSLGSYNVYVDGNKYGVTVSNATAKEVDIAVISSIDFDFTNAKKEYFVGEEFVTTGITATAHYEGGTTGTIAAEDLTYTGFDSTAATTEQTITVTYSGFNGTLTDNTYTINVVEDTISSIAVKAEPTTKTFTVGEALNLDGLVITATYASGKTEDVTYDATETTGHASQFSVKYYSDEFCETEVAVADIAAGTVYAKIVYAEKMTDKIAVTAEGAVTTVDPITCTFNGSKVSTDGFVATTFGNNHGSITINDGILSGTYSAFVKLNSGAKLTFSITETRKMKAYLKVANKAEGTLLKINSESVNLVCADASNPAAATTGTVNTSSGEVWTCETTLQNGDYTIERGGSKELYLFAIELLADSPSASVAVTGVTLDSETTSVAAGATKTLTATIVPSDATNKNVTWSSSNENIATVDENGVVTGVAEGTATITVTTEDGSKTATCEVAVSSNVAVTGITLDKTTLELSRWSTETLVATISPAAASIKTVTWESSDESVVKVKDGVVTAVKAGTATITAKATADETKTATCAVTINPVYVTGDFAISSNEYNGTALTGKLLSNKMYTIAKVDSNGIYCHKGIATNGYTEFALDEQKKITITYSVASGRSSGLVLTTSDGNFTAVEDSGVLIAGSTGAATLDNVLASGDTNTKAAYQTADNSSGSATKTYTYTVVLAAGSYKLYGYTTATSAKASKISFESASTTLTPAITLTAVGSSDITLSYSNGTLTASAVSGATVAENGYKWYVDNALQSGSTSSTLDVSSLVSGIHSIVVTATDSDTKVEYAAQYVLTVQ